METVIIGLDGLRCETVLLRDLLSCMALGAGRHGNFSLMDGRLWVGLDPNPMGPVAGRTGRVIRPSPGEGNPMDAIGKLSAFFGMACPAGVNKIGSKSSRLRVGKRFDIMMSMAFLAGNLSFQSVNTYFE